MTATKSDYTPHDLSVTRTGLLMAHPFFGSLAMRLRYVADYSIPTLCTNGSEMRYNPKFMSRLSEPERKGVFIHELAHCFLLHVFRRGSREHRIFNYAADYAINPMIVAMAGVALPRGVKDETGKVIFTGPLLDKKYAGMSAEAIYAKLMQEKQQEQEKKKQDAGKDEQKGQSDSGEKGDEEKSEGDSESGSSGNAEADSDSDDNGTGRSDADAGGTEPKSDVDG